ncbi:hypothetical protein [Oricola sp.]|uniref:hypothetical protein n=1 Tax=Oricola sp. TaxID=1979950 RepID=UPI0025DED4C3|nr:hypothetical protein [Oricola sp.]MCI5078313.1 hypothetical protein [Oricola sp.]
MALALTSSSPRVRVIPGQGVTTVVIVPRTGVVSFVAMLAVFAFWSFGGLFAMLMLEVANRNGDSGAFFRIWLVAWVVAEIVFLLTIAWRLFGRIVVEARATGLSVARKILFFGPRSTVPASAFSGLSFLPDDPSRRVKVNGRRIPQSALTVRATTGSFRLVSGITREDADVVVAAVRRRLGKARSLA